MRPVLRQSLRVRTILKVGVALALGFVQGLAMGPIPLAMATQACEKPKTRREEPGVLKCDQLKPNRDRSESKWKMLEAPGRFELPTRGLGNRCSIHLSYGAVES